MTNRLVLKIAASTFIVAVLTSMSYFIINRAKHKAEFNRRALSDDFVDFFSITDSAAFKFPDSKKILLVYFNSDCHYCQNEFMEIEQEKEKFSDIQVICFSTESIIQIRKFALQHQLSGNKNFHFAKVNLQQQIEVFGSLIAPSFFIYRDDHLVMELKGQKRIHEIIRYFK